MLIVTVSVFIWLGSAVQIYLLYSAVGQQVPLIFSIAVVPIAILVGMLPVTIAGVGTRDLAIVKLFSGYATTSASISIGILFFLLRYWVLALIGLPLISTLKPSKGGAIRLSAMDSTNSKE